MSSNTPTSSVTDKDGSISEGNCCVKELVSPIKSNENESPDKISSEIKESLSTREIAAPKVIDNNPEKKEITNASSGSNLPCEDDSSVSKSEDFPFLSLNDFNLSPAENDQWISANSKTLFTLGCIKKYHLYPDGTVETSPDEETLKIIQLNGTVKIDDSELPKYFLQIDSWYYPLVPNISPYLRDQNGVFLFPDIKSEGVFVALIIPDETIESFDSSIRSILFPSEETTEDEHFRAPRSRRSIATGIVSGASYISSGLVKGAEKASDAIYYITPQIIKRINSKPLHVNPSVSKSIEGASSITQKTAFVTGYLATQVGRATAALGTYLAPHVHQKGVTLLGYAGVPSQQAEQRMTDVLQVVAGTAEGFATIYDGLNQSSRLLASSLANNSVKIVAHRYGPEAETIGKSTFNLMGDLYNTATNINMLTPKGALKTTLKETGKAIVSSDKPA